MKNKLKYLLVSLLLVVTTSVSASINIPFVNGHEFKDIKEFSSHVNGIRRSNHKINEEDNAYKNSYEMYGGLIKFIDSLTVKCLETTNDEDETKCYRKQISKYTKLSYKNQLIDKVIREKLKGNTDKLHRDEGKNVFFSDKKEKRKEKVLKKIKRLEKRYEDEINGDPDFLGKRQSKKNNNFLNRFKRKIFSKKKLSTLEKKTLSSYLKHKNKFRYLKFKSQNTTEVDLNFEKSLKKLYFRKIKSLGRVKPTTYVLLNYSSAEINKMSELLIKTTKMINSKAGEVVLAHVNYSEMFEQIDIINLEINKLILEMAKSELAEDRNRIDLEIQQKEDLIYGLRKEVLFIDLKDKIEALKINKKEYVKLILDEKDTDIRADHVSKIKAIDNMIEDNYAKIAELTTKVPLSDKDIYNFSIAYLKIQLKEGTISKTFSQTPTFGDVIISAYISGVYDDKTLKALVALPELSECRVSTAKQIGRLVLGIGKILGMSNPVIGPYVTLGFVIFDSIKNKKRMEKDLADETNLINYSSCK
jgi:hypothetical protein